MKLSGWLVGRSTAPLLACLALSCAGLGSIRHLGYDTSTIKAEPGRSLNAVVSIEVFDDQRRANEPEVVFTAEEAPVGAADQQVCFNIERGYATGVPDELRGIIERHLRQRAVIGAWNADAEKYALRGSLITLLGQQSPPPQPSAAALGIVGLATENALTKRPGRVDIAFRALKLVRVRDGAAHSLADVEIHSQSEVAGVGGRHDKCRPIFDQVDADLQRAVTQLAASVELAIRAW
jgi:hypothetical protein